MLAPNPWRERYQRARRRRNCHRNRHGKPRKAANQRHENVRPPAEDCAASRAMTGWVMAKNGIGQSVRRVEDGRFLTGAGRYVDDLVLPRQAYGALVLSPHAHARIVSIESGEARAAPGVLAVLT